MRVFLFDKLLFVQVVVGVVQNDNQSRHIISVNIGETIVLECSTLFTKLQASIWIREGTPIFIGTNLNPKYKNSHRLNITGNHGNGEYFLKINKISEDDLGSYRCEAYTTEGIIQTTAILILRLTTQYRSSWPKSEAQVTTMFEDNQNTATSSNIPEIKYTVVEGLSFNWIFWISGLVGACFVIMLALSLMCTVYFYRKYKIAQITPAQIQHTELQRFQEQRTIDPSSSYEYIDEMMLMNYIEHVHSLDSIVRPLSSVTEDIERPIPWERQYLDVLEETEVEVHPYQSLMINIGNPHQHMDLNKLTKSFDTSFPTRVKDCRPSSLSIMKPICETMETLYAKRANSWPNDINVCRQDCVNMLNFEYFWSECKK